MKYNTQGLLRDWQHNKPAMQELARHAASKTAQKPQLRLSSLRRMQSGC